MAKSNILTDGNKVHCPHCKVPIGIIENGVLPVGFVALLGDKPTTVVCQDCKKPFTYRPPVAPAAGKQMPPRGFSPPM